MNGKEFQLLQTDSRVRFLSKPHEAMDPTCQQDTVQDGSGSIMVGKKIRSSGQIKLFIDKRSLYSAV